MKTYKRTVETSIELAPDMVQLIFSVEGRKEKKKLVVDGQKLEAEVTTNKSVCRGIVPLQTGPHQPLQGVVEPAKVLTPEEFEQLTALHLKLAEACIADMGLAEEPPP